MTLYDAVGLAGTALILGTYALTVGGRIDARRVPYSRPRATVAIGESGVESA